MPWSRYRKKQETAQPCKQKAVYKKDCVFIYVLRPMKDEWWLQKAEELQSFADKNYSAAFFTGLKETCGPYKSTSSSLLGKDGRQLLTEKSEVLDRWKEHFNELLNCAESLAHEDALDSIPQLPVREYLCVSPSMKGLEQAINATKSGQAPAWDRRNSSGNIQTWRYRVKEETVPSYTRVQETQRTNCPARFQGRHSNPHI